MAYRIRDVAQQAGVSKSTVSRVFNRSNLVDSQTRRRVLETARKLDYHPNASAKQLARGGRSDFFALLISDIENPFFPEMIKGFETAAAAKGFDLFLCTTDYHVIEVIASLQPQVTFKERPLLLRNTGSGAFEDVSSKAGPAFARNYLARGLAVGDWDNDGAPDAIFTCIGDRAVLLRNNAAAGSSWIGIQLIGTKSNRDAIGAKVTLHLSDRKLVRWVTGGSSYLSSHDRRLLFGLGTQPSNRKVAAEIQWPSGRHQLVEGLASNRYHRINESTEQKNI